MRHNGTQRLALSAFAICTMVLVGYPGAYVFTHGVDPAGWPETTGGTPRDWLTAIAHGDVLRLILTYVNMSEGRSRLLAGGGRSAFALWAACTFTVLVLIFFLGRRTTPRHPSKRYGDARWASRRERDRMTEGLEIGLDPETGRALRIAVEGNLIAIAPPRSGKTSGLLLTNLAFPEPGSAGGPAVVIDPKGDCYRAVRRRREAIGQTVRCLDPLDLVGGRDFWNPLLRTDPNDILYLQSVARALLPAADTSSENSAYFRGRAVVIIVAALRTAILSGNRDLMHAARLLTDLDAFSKALSGRRDKLSRTALGILRADERTRNPILSSAEQVFEWCLDERLQRAVSENTFQMEELCNGDVDLFIALPSGDQGEILAPYLRWILSDLFNAFRRKRCKSRLIIYIDESFVIGRSDQILKGAGELPGRGISLFQVWHGLGQLIEVYGKHGADIILGTAEVVTLFNLSRALPDETEHWSRAIGSFTAAKSTTSADQVGATDDAVEQRLVAPSDLAGLTQKKSITFFTSAHYTTNPILAKKTFAHRDRRFNGLLDPVPPTGPVGNPRRRI